MGISLGGRGRRSYANYRGNRRPRRRGSDPFRIIILLVLIGGVVWFYYNRDQFTIGAGDIQMPGVSLQPQPTASPTPELGQFVTMAEAAYADGDIALALENYQAAAELAPNNTDLHVATTRLLLLMSAMQYEQQRDDTLALALASAERAVLADPENARGYAIKAMALDWNGRAEEAAILAQQAVDIDPTYAEGHAYLAEAYVDLNRWDQAQIEIQAALELDAFNVDVRRNYAYVLESLGDYAGAAAQYEQALAINSNLAYLHMALGRVYRVLARTDAAVDSFTRVSSMQPDNPISYLEIGWTYHTVVGDPFSALEYMEQAVELDANYRLAWERMGTVHYVQGNWAEAITAMERAEALGGGEDVDVLLTLGIAHASLAECNDAATYLRRALAQAGDNERVESLVEEGFDLCADSGIELVTPTPSP